MRRLGPSVGGGRWTRPGCDEAEGALRIRAAASESSPVAVGDCAVATVAVGLPDFQQRVGDRIAVAVEHLTFDPNHAGRSRRHDLVPPLEREPHAEERADRLGRRQRRTHASSSKGVAVRPRRTMSHRYPRAHSGTVVSGSNFETRRSRPAWSGIDCRTGSRGINGSPGKYIWVTSRLRNWLPKSEKWMCAGL